MNGLALIESDTELKRVASKDGGEYAGSCPFCGGTDRFHVWPDHPAGLRWRCFGHQSGRSGCGRGGDLLAYLVERGDITPQEAGRIRHSDDAQDTQASSSSGARPRRARPVPSGPVRTQAGNPPPSAWQEQARLFVDYCHEQLFSEAGQVALDYLHGRGLNDETIRAWRLGWHDKSRQRSPQRWGLRGKPVWLMRGVTIPWTVQGAVWHVKIRRFEGHNPLTEQGKKYAQITQGCPTLYGLDLLAGRSTVAICEGELDAVLLWQAANDLIDVVAIGTKGAKIALPYLVHLASASTWLVALDNDADAEARDWGHFSDRVRRVRIQQGNDLTDFYQAGGDLRAWLTGHLQQKERPPTSIETLHGRQAALEAELERLLSQIKQYGQKHQRGEIGSGVFERQMAALQATLTEKLDAHQAILDSLAHKPSVPREKSGIENRGSSTGICNPNIKR